MSRHELKGPAEKILGPIVWIPPVHSGPRRCCPTDLAPPLAFLHVDERVADRGSEADDRDAAPACLDRPPRLVGSTGKVQVYCEDAVAQALDTSHIVAECVDTGSKAQDGRLESPQYSCLLVGEESAA